MDKDLARSITLWALVVLAPACGDGGSGGGSKNTTPPGPVIHLVDDFSSGNLNNWIVAGQIVFDGANGNPAPAMVHQGGLNGQATSAPQFNYSGGLTISFDYKMTSASGTVAFGGFNSGTAAAPGYGAGFSISEATLSCLLNGAVIHTETPPNTANWNNYSISFLISGIVEYRVNSVLVFTSAGTPTFPSMRDVLFQVNGTSFGNLSFFDNVTVTTP
jgi:hypothetical protein